MPQTPPRRFALALLLLTLALPAAARGQDDAKALQAKYDDAVAQLKAAQDRKNELSVENDALKARLADLEGRLKQIDDESAERTFGLRASNAAWRAFLETRPELRPAWDRFLTVGPLLPDAALATAVLDPKWPLRAIAAEVLNRPATEPATKPTSEPATKPAPATQPATTPATSPATTPATSPATSPAE